MGDLFFSSRILAFRRCARLSVDDWRLRLACRSRCRVILNSVRLFVLLSLSRSLSLSLHSLVRYSLPGCFDVVVVVGRSVGLRRPFPFLILLLLLFDRGSSCQRRV